MRKFKFLHSSITAKFILIIVLFAILLNVAIWAFFRFSTPVQPKRMFPVYLQKMSDYVIHDIGSPPDTIKARDLSDMLNLSIRYQSNQVNWTSSDQVPDLKELSDIPEFKDLYPNQERLVVPFRGRPLHIFKTQQGVFIIFPNGPQDFFDLERAIIVLVILVTVIFIPLILILRKLFSPIKKLTHAVNQVGEGNYDVDVNINSKDEFMELGNAIKDMSSSIKNSIKSKEQLLMDVSHELRTPLTRIKLGLEVDAPKEKINEDVREIEEMINTLLDSYRFDAMFYEVKPERKKLVPFIEDVIGEFDNDERLWFHVPPNENIEANIDETKFRIVLRNIIDNALKFSSGKVEIFLSDKPHTAEISVKDSGQGIPEKDMEFVFEPFYRADRSRSKVKKGFGLGLSITKKIIDKHNGKIEIRSAEGQGTEVKITLNK